MSARKPDPHLNCFYSIVIGGQSRGSFSQFTPAEESAQVINYRTGNDPPHSRKIPGQFEYGNIILVSGTSNSMDLYNWWKQVKDGDEENARMAVSIMVHDRFSQTVVEQYDYENCWPVKYTPGGFDASTNEIHIETLEIATEYPDRAS